MPTSYNIRCPHDFETGAVVDIKKASADAYAADEHTHVQCMAYRLPGKATTVWMRGDPDPTEFLDYVEDGGELSAFNAPFEWAIWHRTISRQYPHWPRPRPEQMFCTMARALALSLPGSLEKCGEALALDVKKDKAGYRLMLKLCRPTAAWRKNPVGPPQWPGTPEEWQRHAEYCRQDVDAEIAIGERIAELSPQERKLWQLDLRINQRGILLDLPKVQAAITIASAETKRLSAELRTITDKAVPAVSNPAKLLEWLHTRGVELEDARKRTLNLALSQHPLLRLDPATGRARDAAARRAVEIRREAGKASVAKLRAMLACVNADGRARGLLRYHATTTGRWAGSWIQLQNFPRPTLDEETIRGVIEVMGSPHDADTIANCYADPIPAISSSLRALIVPGKGNVFIGGDLSGIEDRGNAWLAGERWKLDAFRALDAGKGVDLYLLTYARSFGVDVAKLPPKGQERQVGKVTSLACGYAGGPFALLSMSMVLEVDVATIAAAMQRITHPADWEAVKDKQPKDLRGLNEDTWAGLKIAVDAYRKGHPAIKEFWSDLEGCAFDAVRYPGRMFTIASGLVKFAATKSFLFCQLPSGRCLAYARPSIESVNRAGERVERGSADAYKEAVFYWGVGKKSKRWERRKLTVPTLAENTVSGTSRDVLVGGMMRAEERGYRIVMHVHDELLAEVPKGFGSAEEFKEIMTEPLPWMKGLPVNASTWQSDRYVKG